MEIEDLNRRSTDVRLEAMEIDLAKALSSIQGAFSRHRQDDHADLSKEDVQVRLKRQDDMESTLNRMVIALEGEPKKNLRGDVIGPGTGGMIARSKKSEQNIEEILHRTNGGVNITYKKRLWTRGEKIAAWSVGSFLFVGMLPTFLSTIRYVSEWVTTL